MKKVYIVMFSTFNNITWETGIYGVYKYKKDALQSIKKANERQEQRESNPRLRNDYWIETEQLIDYKELKNE